MSERAQFEVKDVGIGASGGEAGGDAKYMGIERRRVHRRTGIDPWQRFAKTISDLSDQGMIVVEGNLIRLSARGVHYADTVAAEFLG